jgi:hypothetical protein
MNYPRCQWKNPSNGELLSSMWYAPLTGALRFPKIAVVEVNGMMHGCHRASLPRSSRAMVLVSRPLANPPPEEADA